MDSAIPEPILSTIVAAKVTSVGEKVAELLIQNSTDAIHVPTNTLPLGIGTGAKVYLRILSEASLEDEVEAVSRKVLEQFLN